MVFYVPTGLEEFHIRREEPRDRREEVKCIRDHPQILEREGGLVQRERHQIPLACDHGERQEYGYHIGRGRITEMDDRDGL